MGTARGQEAARHRGPDGLLDRVPRRQAGAGAGRGGRPHLVRADDEDHPDHRQAAADHAARGRAGRDQPGAPGHPRRAAAASTSTRLDGVLHSIGFAPQGAFNFLEGTWEDVADGDARLGVLAQGARGGQPAADVRRRQRRRAHLRRQVRLAGLRLDGRGQGGVRVDQPLPRPRPRPQGHPLQPGLGRPDPHHRRQVDPRLRASSSRSGPTGPRSAGTSTTRCPAAKACAALLSRTGSPPRPARSSTSTAACTRWASSPALPPDRRPRSARCGAVGVCGE